MWNTIIKWKRVFKVRDMKGSCRDMTSNLLLKLSTHVPPNNCLIKSTNFQSMSMSDYIMSTKDQIMFANSQSQSMNWLNCV